MPTVLEHTSAEVPITPKPTYNDLDKCLSTNRAPCTHPARLSRWAQAHSDSRKTCQVFLLGQQTAY